MFGLVRFGARPKTNTLAVETRSFGANLVVDISKQDSSLLIEVSHFFLRVGRPGNIQEFSPCVFFSVCNDRHKTNANCLATSGRFLLRHFLEFSRGATGNCSWGCSTNSYKITTKKMINTYRKAIHNLDAPPPSYPEEHFWCSAPVLACKQYFFVDKIAEHLLHLSFSVHIHSLAHQLVSLVTEDVHKHETFLERSEQLTDSHHSCFCVVHVLRVSSQESEKCTSCASSTQ